MTVTTYTLLVIAQTALYIGIGLAALFDPAQSLRSTVTAFLFAATTLVIFLWR